MQTDRKGGGPRRRRHSVVIKLRHPHNTCSTWSISALKRARHPVNFFFFQFCVAVQSSVSNWSSGNQTHLLRPPPAVFVQKATTSHSPLKSVGGTVRPQLLAQPEVGVPLTRRCNWSSLQGNMDGMCCLQVTVGNLRGERGREGAGASPIGTGGR